NYQAYYDLHHPKKRNWKRTVIGLAALSLTGYGLYYYYWPHHTFPTSVAKLLRKGLWAESNKENNNYAGALQFYIRALEECNNLEIDKLSDEYTGVQLKIAEMLEKLNLLEEAKNIYQELADLYLSTLLSEKIPIETRPHIIQKDLRIVIKLVHLSESDPTYCSNLLLTHCIKAQEEVARRGGSLASNDSIVHPSPKNHDLFISYPVNSQAWFPFRDEFFIARDLYISTCLRLGEHLLAIRSQITTLQWMVMADCDFPDIIMCQFNLGSLLYLQAEEYESRELNAKKNNNEKDIQLFKEEKDECLKSATFCYESILEAVKSFPPVISRDHPQIVEALALTTYSLGVINLHTGNLEKAKELLRRSRLRAKGINNEELVAEAEAELKKLEKEEKLLELKQKENN
ncbi:Mgr3p ASCRUDRAFT_21994, partial [Ascoidea rubescens DSM 1968]